MYRRRTVSILPFGQEQYHNRGVEEPLRLINFVLDVVVKSINLPYIVIFLTDFWQINLHTPYKYSSKPLPFLIGMGRLLTSCSSNHQWCFLRRRSLRSIHSFVDSVTSELLLPEQQQVGVSFARTRSAVGHSVLSRSAGHMIMYPSDSIHPSQQNTFAQTLNHQLCLIKGTHCCSWGTGRRLCTHSGTFLPEPAEQEKTILGSTYTKAKNDSVTECSTLKSKLCIQIEKQV